MQNEIKTAKNRSHKLNAANAKDKKNGVCGDSGQPTMSFNLPRNLPELIYKQMVGQKLYSGLSVLAYLQLDIAVVWLKLQANCCNYWLK